MARIVISGYYGFDNLGDEAVLAGLIRSLRKAAGDRERLELVVLSNSPEDTAADYQVEAVNRQNWQDIYRAISRSDLFISGGGSLLQDVTGWKTIPYYLGLVLLAQLMGKKTIFYAQGVGPVRRKPLQSLIRLVGSRTDLITVRDHRSRELLLDFGLNPGLISVTADPVFALPQPQEVARSEGFKDDLVSFPENDRPLIGIAVRSWGDDSYLPALATAVDRFAALTGGQIVIIPLHFQEDLPVSRRFQDMLEHDSILLQKRYNPGEMIRVFALFDYLIGVRLHSLILAAHCLVPFTAISYDPKVEGFVEMLGLEAPLEIDSLSEELLLKRCQIGWDRREKIRETLEEKREVLREKSLANGRLVLKIAGLSG